jgi:hypothetical protein
LGAANRGVESLNATLLSLTDDPPPQHLAFSVTRASDGELIVKLVNTHNATSLTVSLEAHGPGHLQLQSGADALDAFAAFSISGLAGDENSLAAPEKIRIRELAVDPENNEVVLPPMSVSCVRLAPRSQAARHSIE